MAFLLLLLLLVATGVAIGACGGSGAAAPSAAGEGAGSPDAGGGSPGDAGAGEAADGAAQQAADASPPAGYPAPHAAPPQVVDLGGPVLSLALVVPITFPGDPLAADIEAFTAKIGTSTYWATVTAEYGVGAVTSATPVHVTTAAPASIDDTAIQQWIKTNVGGLLPEPTTGTVYAIFYPATTTVTWNGAASCAENEGYHWDVALDATRKASYVVIPRCDNLAGAAGVTGIDATTLVASHEYVESATDPFPTLDPAYGDLDADHTIWGVLEDTELADLCVWAQGANIRPADLGYLVQRIWSNAAIAAGHDPCVPAAAPAEAPYFNSVPDLEDTVTISSYGESTATKGVKIPVGQSRTIDVVLYSDAPTGGPWTLSAVDAPYYGIPATTHDLSFAFDPPQGQNGDHVKLTITANAYDPQIGGAPFMITSTLGSRANTWFGVVGQ